MSSMLRKGGKTFKPSVRPRPNVTRPSSSQPATRPSSEVQLQTPVSATESSNLIPALTEDVTEKEASHTTTSQSIQVTSQSQTTPQAQAQTSLRVSINGNSAKIDTTAKKRFREHDVDTTAELEQPPSKARKLTPPLDEVQNSENSAPSKISTVPSTNLSSTSDKTSASSNIQGSNQSSRDEQHHATDKELPFINPSSIENDTNETHTSAKEAHPSINSTSATAKGISQINATTDKSRTGSSFSNIEAAGQNIERQNLEPEKNSQNTVSSATGAPAAPEQVVDGLPQITPESSEDADLSGMGAGEATQVPHLVSTVTSNSEQTPTPNDEEATPAAKKPRKKSAPRKKKVQVEDGEEPRTEVEIQLNRPRRTLGQKRQRKGKDGGGVPKTRKAREGTPENAENEVIEPATMKMADLCTDIRIGKKFSKHDELKMRHTRKKIDAQLAERPELAGLINNAPPESNSEPHEEPSLSMNNNGLQMRVIDGQIVLDDRSLQVDRHRQARDEGLVLEEIEENEFTKAVNSGQYMKRSTSVRWDSDANELFYQGLRQFGTAFEMIAAMFPDRNRRQIKLKFVREERQNPAKVDRALKGKTDEIDFEEYTQLTGQKFEDSAEIQAEHQRLEDEHNAEEARVAASRAEADRKKKEAISNAARRGKGGASDGDDGTESQKENTGAILAGAGRKRTAKSKNSNRASMHGGGEEIEILGTV
ncbi:hypothetical protein EYC80_002503 [Monilinia laxa]|uniref:Transcription factor TFIIIB component B'' Myb domain-containing protein n=1 Tax=Monilinia laxa TaxID=61186 RepID=A0A5N6K413_MONLA|nr:hypothetical protein EYC80_002503 [Monilinia laxa]